MVDFGTLLASLAILVIVFLLTFLVEAMTEYIFGTVFNKLPLLTPYKWLLMYLALAFGIALCFYYKIDIIAILARFLSVEGMVVVTPVGMLLTGLAVGRGSNFLHQLVSQFFPMKK